MRLLLTILTGWLLLSPPAHGCGLCFSIGNNPLALPHPRAIEIAVATRTALDHGVLQALPGYPGSPTEPGQGWNKRAKLSGAPFLTTWTKTAGSVTLPGAGEPFSVHVVLVDAAASYTIHVRAGSVVLDPGATGHADAVVATTQVALQAVLSGKVPWGRAVELGLLLVDGNESYARVLSPAGLK